MLYLPILLATFASLPNPAGAAATFGVPTVAATSVGSPLVFSEATFNAISLQGELDASAGEDAISLSVTEGTVSLASTTGLTFHSGSGSGDSSVSFSGDAASIEAGLDGMTYTPPSAPYAGGRPTLTASVVDSPSSGGSGTVLSSTEIRIAVNAPLDCDSARDALLDGVTSIYSGGSPGHLLSFGDDACDVALFPSAATDGYYDNGPLVAAASYGSGRAIAVPDYDILEMDKHWDSTGQFYDNTLSWLARAGGSSTSPLDAKIVVYDDDVETWLEGRGYSNVVTTNEEGLIAALAGADIFCGWLGNDEPEANVNALKDFVATGGGLFTADHGHYYIKYWDKPIYEAPANMLLREAGLGFPSTREWVSGVLEMNSMTRATGKVTANNVITILDDPSNSGGTSESDLNQASHVFSKLRILLSQEDPLFKRIHEIYLTRINQVNPTRENRILENMVMERALLRWEKEDLLSTPPADTVAHRQAEELYGVISPNAPRITSATVSIDTSRARWHPTGLYAVPGEVVTVTVPPELVARGYKIAVNGHDDSIEAREEWERPPRVHRVFAIDAEITEVANAFGGAIFIDVGHANGPSHRKGGFLPAPDIGTHDVQISGAIEHPYFVLGVHTDQEWVESLRDKPGPYAVLVSPSFVIVQRSSWSADLTEPTKVMNFWQNSMDMMDDLAQRVTPRSSAEILNVDVQISNGAAHSGYPIQAWERHWGNSVDLEGEDSFWGNYHEVGHNLQRDWWTLDIDGEVTNNIFSTLCRRANNPENDGWMSSPVGVMRQAVEAVNLGMAYANPENVWYRLAMWLQLVDGFGWNALKAVFRSYEEDDAYNEAALPTTEAEVRDQLLLRYSQAVGHDLTEFMRDAWGWQVSDSAVSELGNLPTWMPAMGGIEGDVTTLYNTPITFDLAGEALALDGIVTIEDVTQALSGTVENNGDGTFSYTPYPGFVGADQLVYTVVSSSGHGHATTIDIEVFPEGIHELNFIADEPSELLNECEGDCSNDEDCAEGLVCYQRDSGESGVPGCRGTEVSGQDYCIRPTVHTGNPVLQLVGDGAGPWGLCEGDCDSNGQCEGDLICHQRGGKSRVPGCDGTGVSGKDYCILEPGPTHAPTKVPTGTPTLAPSPQPNTSSPTGLPTLAPSFTPTRTPTTTPTLPEGIFELTFVGLNPNVTLKRLDACMGDCDKDSDCADGLVCYQRDSGEEDVPGCVGIALSSYDYCIVPTVHTGNPIVQHVGDGAGPWGLCEGDCDSDGQCEGDLVCHERGGRSRIPGCDGTGVSGKDYCILPSGSPHEPSPTHLPTQAPTSTPSVIPTKEPTQEPSSSSPTHAPSQQPMTPAPTSLLIAVGQNPNVTIKRLDACAGDCDSDQDCADGLVCYQRDSGEEDVPGCAGIALSSYDYCIVPTVHTGNPIVQHVGDGAGPWGLCEGDCDSDAQCEGDLVCHERGGRSRIPGCDGTGIAGKDYCIVRPEPTYAPTKVPTGTPTLAPSPQPSTFSPTRTPTTTPTLPEGIFELAFVGLNPNVTLKRLDACMGDCDYDSDCADGLVCYQRDSGEEGVPGCAGIALSSYDYCIVPTVHTGNPIVQHVGDGAGPWGLCEGDCDSDSQCEGDLVCHERGGRSRVPGCDGTGVSGKDYCVIDQTSL